MIFVFLKRGDLSQDCELTKEIKAKAGLYLIECDKLYKRTTLKSGLLCMAREGFDRVMFEAYKEEYDTHLGGKRLSQ